MQIPILTIIGRSGAGKTTLIEKLIAELGRRGIRVATVKHHAHPGLEVDRPGSDSWRFAQAGSAHVILAAPDTIIGYRRPERELSLDEVVAGISGVDLILVEGYKRAGKPAIEVLRSAVGGELLGDPAYRIAVVSDRPVTVDVPRFDLDDVREIADFVQVRVLNGPRASSGSPPVPSGLSDDSS